MKNYCDVVGIDVSKLTIDAHIHKSGLHRVFSNTVKGFKALSMWLSKCLETQRYFVCFENTGHYSTYAWLHKEELTLSIPKDSAMQELGRLLSFREQLVRDRTGKISSLKEMQSILNSPSTDSCCKIITKTISYLTKQIEALEARIKDLMQKDVLLKKNFELLNTLKGVGLILSCQLIYHTNNFTRFASWRQFSSYCGVAPFEHSSGTSIKRRNRIHHIGDRKMKTLLTLASVSAIQCDKELKYYYKKKVAEGKPKMVALNNVRNKILSRAFAVIKRGTPYVPMQQFAA